MAQVQIRLGCLADVGAAASRLATNGPNTLTKFETVLAAVGGKTSSHHAHESHNGDNRDNTVEMRNPARRNLVIAD